MAAFPGSGKAFPFSWGIALAAVSLVAIGGGAILWSQSIDEGAVATSNPQSIRAIAIKGPGRVLPQRPSETNGNEMNSVYSVTRAVENGTSIMKIKVTQTGDELIVDAGTGRLLETRPSRPPGPRPMDRVVVPFHPVT